jgi:hypothetical protein
VTPAGTTVAADVDPRAAVETLAAWRTPFLIGVRHHSPVLATAVPILLDLLAPDLLLVEMPAELQPWLPWLGADGLEAPVALAAVRADGSGLLFYPYADFSPELAAVRWAVRHGVPVEAFDLPVSRATHDSTEQRTRLAPETPAPLSEALGKQLGTAGGGDLWDRLVEVRAAGARAEEVRRAALAVGWALRLETATWGQVPAGDLQREVWMRARVAAASERGVERPAAVIGAFHAPALLSTEVGAASPQQQTWPSGGRRASARREKPVEIVTSLIPYAFELLDSRTGYPAGIHDPEWQQAVWHGGCTPEAAIRAAQASIVRICRALREHGHPAGVPDARESSRLAVTLASLRGLSAPGRGELVEALQTCLAQGEPHGRGRAVAAAMQQVLVGRRRGQLATGTPRSGLVPHIEGLFSALRFPGPRDAAGVEMRLDPLRSELDRRRYVTIQRLDVCGVPYADALSLDVDQLTSRWWLRWTPSTSAMLELAGLRGVTLAQAAEGALRLRRAEAERDQRVTARWLLAQIEAAAECGAVELAQAELQALTREFRQQATLVELIDAVELVDRLGRGHVPAFDPSIELREQLTDSTLPSLIGAALNQVEGLVGSQRTEDAQALLALVQRLQRGDAGARVLGDSRLRWALERLEREGSPLMQGAGGAVRVLLGHLAPEALGERLGSWVDVGVERGSQSALAGRLRGVLLMAAPLLEAAPAVTRRLFARIEALDDPAFLARLPALREAFDVLSPAARQRFLDGTREDERLVLEYPPVLLARWAAGDRAGWEAAAGLDTEALSWGSEP